MKLSKIFTFILTVLVSQNLSLAYDFDFRIDVVDCNTIQVQVQSTNASSTPGIGDDISDYAFFFRSPNTISFGTPSFSMGFNGTLSYYDNLHGEEVYVVSINSAFQISSGQEWTTNTWHTIMEVEVTGSTNFQIADENFDPGNTDPYISINSGGDIFDVEATDGILAKTWVGGTNGFETSWSTATNWCPASAPSSGEKIFILNQTYDPVLSTDITLDSLHIASGGTLTLSGNQITLSGGLTGTGTMIGSSSSSLVFNGNTSSTLTMDTSQWDTTNLLDDLTVNLTGGASLTLGSKVGVLGILTATAGTITTGGHLRICATSASTYGQISPTGSGTISGELTVQKALSNTNDGWRHIGLPVVGTLDAIDSFPVLDSNHSILAEKNIKYWDAEPVTGNLNPGWTVPDSTFDNTRGYVLYGANGVLAFDQIWSVTGTIATGAQTRDVYYNEPAGSGGSDDNGWNLIANPYASNLDIATMWTTAFDNLTYKAIHIYDQMNDRYFAMTAGGVNIINGGGASDTALSSSVIAPFQAFWVKTDNTTTVDFTDNDRTTDSTGLGTFMKKEYDLARLDVYTADSAWDQTVIYFDENGNPGLDNGLDAYKLFSYDPKRPNLYSVSLDGNFSINALDLNIQTHSVPLGFSSKTGQVSFKLNTADLDAKWFVYLEDKQLGIFYNIKEKPYTFNHTQNSDSRFVLHFQTYGLSAEKLVSDVRNMNISGDGNEVYVFVPAFYKDQSYQLEVIDMAGRVVYTDNKLALTHGMNTLNLDLHANAYYAVRIKAAEGIASGKVQIR